MLRDYIERLYEPAARQGKEMSTEAFARTRQLATWKSRVREAWGEIHVVRVEGDAGAANVGQERTVVANVHLGRLSASDVSVQLAHGSVGPGGELNQAQLTEMQPQGRDGEACRYQGSFVAASAGLYGFTVRVLPAHRDLIDPQDLGLVRWSPE
jgi:starch phosphorylase